MATEKKSTIAANETRPEDIDVTFRNPGFLIRRAQQISVSSFMEHYGHLGVTPTQAAILKVVIRWPGIDQVGVGRVLGLDRTTATTSVTTLAGEKLLERRNDPSDRRRRALYITVKGERLVSKVGNAEKSARTMLSVFSEDDARTFMRLLEHFVVASNDTIRVPMEHPTPDAVIPRAKRTKHGA